jgi:diaminohydroxyphosphoribosylaminopyrimidine deaminase/5-amino-6-(5-phosphoribosylamino)uracil reductase
MDYMALALALAKLAQGQVSPNPAVGAVIVIQMFWGYTQPPVPTMRKSLPSNRRDWKLAAQPLCFTRTLLPFWRTPCTRAIIEAGISEVHFPIIDPNPAICGKGHEALQQAGIRTFVGEHAEEATEVNEAFIKYITTRIPFVTVKFASSLDGKIATRTGDSKWVTGEAARRQVQRMRYIADAVMTGANTVIVDDPHLTVRLLDKGGTTRRQPLRIIVDGRGRTPPGAQIFREPGKTIVVLDQALSPEVKNPLKEAGADVLELPSHEGDIDLSKLLKLLGERHITSVLVEAGGILLGSLFDNGLVDKVVAFLAPMIIGGEEARPSVAGKGIDRL